jgi:spermidine synthase
VEKVAKNLKQKYYFEKCQRKQSPKGRYFAQSSHPVLSLKRIISWWTTFQGFPTLC